MTDSQKDIWSQWLLKRRFSGDREQMKATLINFLYPVRDRVLKNANLNDGKILLDVGCGDGLIAFGALEKFNMQKVIFSDISQDLLDYSQSLASEMQVLDRCEFVRASADDLSSIPDESVDTVTTRSVLIYVSAKQKAFGEFFRVLRPGGRLSIFEPINRFAWPEQSHLFSGYDVTPILAITAKVRVLYERLQPVDTDSMLNFDERDLILFAEKTGFKEIHLELEVDVKPPTTIGDWEAFIKIAPNPKIPTLQEAIQQTLTPEEAEKFIAHLRPLVESKQGTTRSSLAYLWAVK